jgi:NAD(P)-dependent dehydrogenase (short-subunit alcohol dehydrogenase family)
MSKTILVTGGSRGIGRAAALLGLSKGSAARACA